MYNEDIHICPRALGTTTIPRVYTLAVTYMHGLCNVTVGSKQRMGKTNQVHMQKPATDTDSANL